MDDDLVQALAGAVLLRDRLAEASDQEGTHLALLTVDALNRVCAIRGISTSGRAKLITRPGQLPTLGFTS